MTTEPGPVLLTSLASAALLDGRGDLHLLRETRGTAVDWGGVYAQLVRLTGPWRLSLRVGDAETGLPTTLGASSSSPGVWESHHRWGRLEIVQRVAAIADPPGVLRSVRATATPGPAIDLVIESDWSPFLLPVLIEGVRPVRYQAETRGDELRVRQRGFGLSLRSSVLPRYLYLNRGSWIGGRYEGPIEEIGSEHQLTVNPGHPAEISLLLSGGLERSFGPSAAADRVLSDPAATIAGLGAPTAEWIARTPTLQFPDAPDLERAYTFARAALRSLYTAPGDGLVGLVAGYPWYSAIWCRDLAWMLPAVLWMGDHDWTERSLASVFRFQSHADVPILGGARGELPMQVSPGPIFLFGTSDTTLYYPGLVERWLRHSGRTGGPAPWADVLGQILAWGEARTDPATGLFRNGGEAHSIGAVTRSIARVRYGIDAPDTTIWDSTDRRDHAIDLQILWHEALLAGAQLLGPSADDVRGARWRARAAQIEANVLGRYRWPEEGYLFDSLDANGPVRKVRPNALRAASAPWLGADLARSVVRRAAQADLTTGWGVRTLSARHPTYDPSAYHDGQVWTIATAWAADAAFAAGETELGLGYLRTIAARYDAEHGFANECYRGDLAEPFDSCFLLGFSVAPFLTALFERLWGLRVDAPAGQLEVRPNFPTAWRSASLHQLAVGSGRADLDWSPEHLTVRWTGSGPLTVVTRQGRASIDSGSVQELPLGGSAST